MTASSTNSSPNSELVACAIPVYKRPDVTRRVVQHLIDIGQTQIITCGDAETGLCPHLEWKNEPLGEKFNAAVRFALGTHPDAYYACVIGSDSFIHRDYFAEVASMRRFPYVNTNGVYFWWPETGRMLLSRRFRSGSGVFLSRQLVEAAGEEPYYPFMSRDLDASPRRFSGCGGIYQFQMPWVLEERSSVNMWPEEWIETRPHTEEVDPGPVLEAFGVSGGLAVNDA